MADRVFDNNCARLDVVGFFSWYIWPEKGPRLTTPASQIAGTPSYIISRNQEMANKSSWEWGWRNERSPHVQLWGGSLQMEPIVVIQGMTNSHPKNLSGRGFRSQASDPTYGGTQSFTCLSGFKTSRFASVSQVVAWCPLLNKGDTSQGALASWYPMVAPNTRSVWKNRSSCPPEKVEHARNRSNVLVCVLVLFKGLQQPCEIRFSKSIFSSPR